MSGVAIRIEGHDAAIAALAGIAARLAEARPMYDEIGGYLTGAIQRRFERGETPGGNPWPPSYRARATGGKTLIDSARLMQSFTHNAWGQGVEVGTNVEYAAIHQFGGTIRRQAHSRVLNFKTHARSGQILKGFRKKRAANFSMKAEVGAYDIAIPARPFLGLDAADAAAIVTVAEGYIGRLGASP